MLNCGGGPGEWGQQRGHIIKLLWPALSNASSDAAMRCDVDATIAEALLYSACMTAASHASYPPPSPSPLTRCTICFNGGQRSPSMCSVKRRARRLFCFSFCFCVFFARLCGLFSISIRQSWYNRARSHCLSISLSPSHPLSLPLLSLSLACSLALSLAL